MHTFNRQRDFVVYDSRFVTPSSDPYFYESQLVTPFTAVHAKAVRAAAEFNQERAEEVREARAERSSARVARGLAARQPRTKAVLHNYVPAAYTRLEHSVPEQLMHVHIHTSVDKRDPPKCLGCSRLYRMDTYPTPAPLLCKVCYRARNLPRGGNFCYGSGQNESVVDSMLMGKGLKPIMVPRDVAAQALAERGHQ